MKPGKEKPKSPHLMTVICVGVAFIFGIVATTSGCKQKSPESYRANTEPSKENSESNNDNIKVERTERDDTESPLSKLSLASIRAMVIVNYMLGQNILIQMGERGEQLLPNDDELAEFTVRAAILENARSALAAGQFSWKEDELSAFLDKAVEVNRLFFAVWENEFRKSLVEKEDPKQRTSRQAASLYDKAFESAGEVIKIASDLADRITLKGNALMVEVTRCSRKFQAPPKFFVAFIWIFNPNRNASMDPAKGMFAYMLRIHYALELEVPTWRAKISRAESVSIVSFIKEQIEQVSLSAVENTRIKKQLSRAKDALLSRCRYLIRNPLALDKPDLKDSTLGAAVVLELLPVADALKLGDEQLEPLGFGALHVDKLRTIVNELKK